MPDLKCYATPLVKFQSFYFQAGKLHSLKKLTRGNLRRLYSITKDNLRRGNGTDLRSDRY